MAKLAKYVHVAGRLYGPGDEPPDEVARKIRNPKAWKGGEAPSFTAESVGSNEGDGASPERPADSAAKDVWVDYVLSVADLDESTVKAMTKPQLIAKAEEAEQAE